MEEELGEAYPAFLSSYEKPPVTALRLNPLKRPKPSLPLLKEVFPRGEFFPLSYEKNGYIYSGDITPGKHPLHSAGLYYIQEPSAMSPVAVLKPEPGDRVLDLCAAPGGKSTQIAGYLKGKGLIVSNEPVASRAKILSENIERMGIKNAVVTNEMPDRLSGFFPEYFDKILVDAPCSGEGMFRKNPEAIEEWSLSAVESCAVRQSHIIESADKMLRPGGMLCYSTCTFSKKEDEEVRDSFLNKHPEYTLITSEKLYPHSSEGEGHFYALFKKEGEAGSESRLLKTMDSSPLMKCKPWQAFRKDIKTEAIPEKGCFTAFGNEIYLTAPDFPAIKQLKVLRAGLHLGTLKGELFRPSHGLALYLSPEDYERICPLSADSDELKKYLHGETLPFNGTPGWYLITAEGYSIGWGKASNNTMKNHYPKGLRNHGYN